MLLVLLSLSRYIGRMGHDEGRKEDSYCYVGWIKRQRSFVLGKSAPTADMSLLLLALATGARGAALWADLALLPDPAYRGIGCMSSQKGHWV